LVSGALKIYFYICPMEKTLKFYIMKTIKTISIIAVAGLINISVLAQTKIKVIEVKAKMSQGVRNGLSVNIPVATDKSAEKSWKKLMKGYNAKLSSSKGDLFADNALISSLSTNTVDVYTKIIKTNEGVKVTFFFNLGGAFLNSSEHSNMYPKAERIVYDFAIVAAKEAVGAQLADEQKVQKKLEKDLKNLLSANEKLHKNIADYKNLIKETEENIVKNEKNQQTKQKEIVAQKEVLKLVNRKMDAIR